MEKIKLATISFHISAAVYVFLGLVLIALSQVGEFYAEKAIIFAGGIICFVLATFVETVVYYLNKRKLWAWVCAMILSALYIPSLFIALGILAMIGLLSKETRKTFKL